MLLFPIFFPLAVLPGSSPYFAPPAAALAMQELRPLAGAQTRPLNGKQSTRGGHGETGRGKINPEKPRGGKSAP